MTIIEVCERAFDWWSVYTLSGERLFPKHHAQIQGNPGMWGCGKTPQEAINSLVRAWKIDEDRQVIYLEGARGR